MSPPNAKNYPLQPNPSSDRSAKRLHALTRLLVGGTEVGLEELFRQLDRWEQKIAEEQQNADFLHASPEPLPFLPDGLGSTVSVNQTETNTPSTAVVSPTVQTEISLGSEAGEFERLKYALIGLVFEAEEQLSKGASTAHRLEKAATKLVAPITRPVSWVTRSRLFSPVRAGFNHLADRGEDEINRWIARGQLEESRSRKLAQIAFDDTVDESIGYLTNNPEVQELVQTQSTGLANEVIEEVRERTVSADTFVEGLVRTILRRSPRNSLPEPPHEVRQRVTSLINFKNFRGK